MGEIFQNASLSTVLVSVNIEMSTQQSAEDAAILGLNDTEQSVQTPVSTSQPRRRVVTTRVSLETLQSSHTGLPILFKHLSHFKFQKRNSASAATHKRRKRIGSAHHFENLENLLNIYQSWYHSINPRVKFNSMILNMNSSLKQSECSAFLNQIILQDRERKRQKIEQKQYQKRTGILDATIGDRIVMPRAVDGEGADEEEEFSQLFGGVAPPQPQTQEEEIPLEIIEEAEQEEEYNKEMAIREAKFSTMLQLSSQTVATSSQKEISNDQRDGFGDFFSDDEMD